MTTDLQEDFYHLATVEAEIRQDIRRYERMGLTPMDFAVRVKTHPKLAVTSRLKMQNVRLTSASYSEQQLQTFLFKHDDAKWLGENITATRELLSGLQPHHREKQKFLFRDLPVSKILRFLEDYNVVDDHRDLRFDLLKRYIQTENKHGSLLKWNIGVFGSTAGAASLDLGFGTVPCVTRSRFRRTEPASIKALISPADRVFDIDAPRPVSMVKDLLVEHRNQFARRSGYLLLYPIDRDSKPRTRSKERSPLDAAEHIIGMGLIFPESMIDQREYVANELIFLQDGQGLYDEIEQETDETELISEDDEMEQEG